MKCSIRKLWPWLIGILMLLWIYIAFYSMHGYRETLIPSGADQFTATFSRVSNIVPINEDVSQHQFVEDHKVSMTIIFTDETDGTTHQVDLSDCALHTNGYTSVDNVHSDDLPLELTVGHTYTVQYWAVCEDQNLTDLSLAIYGEEVSFRWLQVLLVITMLCGGAGLVLILRSDRHWIPAMLVLWCSTYILFLLSVPLQLGNAEQRAFGRAYAVSNELMGLEAVDENGYVYVDDIGLRNSGYLVYDVPFYRFWSNIGSATDVSRDATVTYQDDGGRTLHTYIDAVVITAARKTGVSYPLVYLSGSLFVGAMALIVLGILLIKCQEASIRIRVMSIALLPSLMTTLQLHSGFAGLFRPFDATLSWMRLDEMIERLVLYISPADGTAYLITYVPIAVLILWIWKSMRKETISASMEKILLVCMVTASWVTALLRF